MKVKILNKEAILPEIVNGIVLFKAIDAIAEVGRDNKLVLSYKTGLSITLNEDEIGIIVSPERSVGNSLYMASGTMAITSSNTDELIIRYKVNTDAIPSLFDKDDVIARMIIVKKNDIDMQVEELQVEADETKDVEK